MKRRLILAAALLPAVVRAQQQPPLIGVMRVNARSAEQFEQPLICVRRMAHGPYGDFGIPHLAIHRCH